MIEVMEERTHGFRNVGKISENIAHRVAAGRRRDKTAVLTAKWSQKGTEAGGGPYKHRLPPRRAQAPGKAGNEGARGEH